jgi:hypothetical protein
MKNAVFWDVTRATLVRTDVPPKRRFLQEPHGVTTRKTAFFIDTAMKTSNLTLLRDYTILDGELL